MKSKKYPAKLVALSLIGALLVLLLFIAISYYMLISSARAERDELVKLTSAFIVAYSEGRGDSSAVPAIFRRKGLAYYSDTIAAGSLGRLKMEMPGLPGHEIHTKAADPEVRSVILEFQRTGDRTPRSDTRFAMKGGFDRTIYPSVASSETCVSCHNSISDSKVWKTGDVMGALVVESDLSGAFKKLSINAILIFITSFMILVAISSYFTKVGRRALQIYTDELTGIGNRRFFSENAQRLLKGRSSLVLVIIDLDEFKAINDTYGHATGDEFLCVVASRIEDYSNLEGGVCARLGGDEFALMIPLSSTHSNPQKIGLDLIGVVGQPFDIDDIQLLPKLSVGIVATESIVDRNLNDLMSAADVALYEAKGAGKNTVECYNDKLSAKHKWRTSIAASITDSIENGELEVLYQPQVLLPSGSLRGFECLVRWNYNGKKLVPSEFIDVLEEINQIQIVDEWVLNTGLDQLAVWLRSGCKSVSLSVNLSSLHFQSGNLVNIVRSAIDRSQVPPHLLVLEITETVLLHDYEQVSDVLAELTALGVSISLDDFGSGYSSLSYLCNLQFDEVKIDKSFVRDLEISDEARFVFDGIVDIVDGLGKRVIVEGIETYGQLEIASRNGVHMAQGYLFGRALSLADATDLLQRTDIERWTDIEQRLTAIG